MLRDEPSRNGDLREVGSRRGVTTRSGPFARCRKMSNTGNRSILQLLRQRKDARATQRLLAMGSGSTGAAPPAISVRRIGGPEPVKTGRDYLLRLDAGPSVPTCKRCRVEEKIEEGPLRKQRAFRTSQPRYLVSKEPHCGNQLRHLACAESGKC